MKVKDLINQLQKLDQESIVVLSRDPEGNGFNPLEDVESSMFHEEWEEVRLKELTPELEEQGYSDEDLGLEEDGFIPAVVLWP